ncbi:MAG: sporulation protein YqfD [Clostridia bacterium]|nr:sporulation protein YqfD [Clostridia bacterium]
MIANFFMGTARLTFENTDAAKVFSLLSRREIPFTGSKIVGTRSQLRIPLYRLKETEPLKDLINIEICGFPKLIINYKKRWGIAAGALIFSFLVYISGTVIWTLDITGNHNISDEYITGVLEKVGCCEGTRIKGLDFDVINNRFLIESEGIAWISVNMNGTHANVEVRETRQGYETAGEVLYNLVANEDGQIERMASVEGKPQVVINDAVSKGDILVSGIITYNENMLRFESARGSVFAKVTREFDVEVPFEYEKKTYTGEEINDYSVRFFKNRINLFTNYGIPYGFYGTIVTDKRADISGVPLPLVIDTVSYKEYKTEKATLTEKEANDILMSEYRKKLSETLAHDQLLSKTVRRETGENSVKLHCSLYCLADIAEKKEIKINNTERADKIGTENNKYTQ